MKSRRSTTARPLRGPLHVVEIDAAVLVDARRFPGTCLRFEAGVVGLDLVARIEAVGLDEQPARPRSRGNGRRG